MEAFERSEMMFTFKMGDTRLDPSTFMLHRDIHIEISPEDMEDLRVLNGPQAVKTRLIEEFTKFIDTQLI